ncbi:MAG TPA: DEAD/DEAH box helicase, partial [Thermoguttaceae bacterium]|nr:DEAD/DEAH box helicase [Thermoguttaceae bacterium]
QPTYSQVYLHYGAQREVIFRPGAECPKPLATYARRYFDDHGRLKPDGFAKFHLFLKRVTAGKHECRCYEDALQFIAQIRDKQRLQQQVAKTFSGRGGNAAMKKLLKVSLYPYQKTGAMFAAAAGRCLIADDMGLGKTIQAIAAAEILARETGIERVLVVAPTSLKHQWKQEIEKFTGRDAQVVEGLLPQRTAMYAEPSFYKITNYDVIHRDFAAIESWQPDLIILDEAQRIKNWKTRTAQSVKRLESEYAIVLTGTPLENRLEELHSIVEFVDRHRLGPMFRFLAEHQHVDETGRVVGYRNLKNISETLEPILIRRTKDNVLKELPERLEKRFFVPMTPQQVDYHEENRETVARIVHKWRKYGFLREADQRRMQIALQAMRMSCNSTYLLDQETDHGVKADEVVDLLAEIFEEPQAKVVVFSQWVRMHELVVRRLQERKWDHVMFHGRVPGPKRKGLIQRFKQDPACRLFLSTDAGGVGLNLQNASAVVNLDQPWNPAVLEQRIGRVHRLGQKNPVRVVHFIAQGTIEEGMLGLLKFKSALAGGVLDNGENEVFLGGSRLKKFMESVEKATGGISETKVMPSEPNIAEPAIVELAEAKAPAAPQPVAPEQVWNEVLTAGMALVEKLGQALGTGGSGPQSPSSGGLVTRDEQTGQSYLKLPMPEPETMQKIVELFGSLTRGK